MQLIELVYGVGTRHSMWARYGVTTRPRTWKKLDWSYSSVRENLAREFISGRALLEVPSRFARRILILPSGLPRIIEPAFVGEAEVASG